MGDIELNEFYIFRIKTKVDSFDVSIVVKFRFLEFRLLIGRVLTYGLPQIV
jgi:hypothetical protein